MDLQLAGRRALSPAATTGGISKAGDGAANAGTWGPPGSPVRSGGYSGASVRHSRL